MQIERLLTSFRMNAVWLKLFDNVIESNYLKRTLASDIVHIKTGINT